MELVRWEPFDQFNKIHSRLNELFEEDPINHGLGQSGVGPRRWIFWKAMRRTSFAPSFPG